MPHCGVLRALVKSLPILQNQKQIACKGRSQFGAIGGISLRAPFDVSRLRSALRVRICPQSPSLQNAALRRFAGARQIPSGSSKPKTDRPQGAICFWCDWRDLN
jgi:hypothetical protein